MVHDHDTVGLEHCRKAMRDDDGSAVAHQPLKRLLDQSLALGVERARRFVQQQDGRVAQDRAGNRDPLALTSGESRPTLAQESVVAVGEPADELVGGCGNRGRLDLRIAQILAATAVPGSKKLVELRVSVGAEERTMVAGILLDYAPADLVGKQIVIVSNLKPSKLMGVESRGMLLAASGADGKLVLVTPERPAQVGSKVK